MPRFEFMVGDPVMGPVPMVLDQMRRVRLKRRGHAAVGLPLALADHDLRAGPIEAPHAMRHVRVENDGVQHQAATRDLRALPVLHGGGHDHATTTEMMPEAFHAIVIVAPLGAVTVPPNCTKLISGLFDAGDESYTTAATADSVPVDVHTAFPAVQLVVCPLVVAGLVSAT